MCSLGDLTYALRQLVQHRGFALVVIITLAVGMGANTAVFSIVKTVVLAPLPYPDSDRLVVLRPYPWMHTAVYLDLERTAKSIEELAGYYPRRFAVTGGDQPAELESAEVTPNFFRFLGAEVIRGRDFSELNARAGAPRTAIISYGAWQRRYGGSPDVIGRFLRLNGEPHEIIGVVERGFSQLAPRSQDPELWVPLEIHPTNAEGNPNWVIPIARLRAGSPLQQAQSELDAILSRYKETLPEEQRLPRPDYDWEALKSDLIGDVQPALVVLQLAVGVVLLLSCVNVANLLLVRFGSRQGEVALRTALGASRGRLVRQVLTESVVLSVLGGLAGLLLMLFSLELMLAWAPRDVPRIGEVTLDGLLFAFALGISVVTGLLFGAVPAMTTTRQAPQELLKEIGRATAGSLRKHRISQGLVVAQVTLTLVLVVGASLMVRSFVALAGQEPGFRTENVLAVRMRVPENRYRSVARLEDFYRRALESLKRIPGVESVAVTNRLPIDRGGSIRELVVEGEAESRTAHYGVVSPDYFDVLDISLLRGRYFGETDGRANVRVAIVDEAMWRGLWPGQDPLGKRIRFVDEDTWLTVVGVVADIRGSGLANEPRPGLYIPYRQRPVNVAELAVGRNAFFLVRSQASVENLAAALRRGVWDVDPLQPVPEIVSLDNLVARGLSPQRFRAALLGAFAAIALILVIAGIYGVVAYLVEERTHEFGIRMAMGATGSDMVRRVLRWGLRLTAIGVGLGIVGVFLFSRFLVGLLFGVTPMDPWTVLASVVALVLVGLAACFVPVRRAARVDPVEALRYE
jgi:putative ABC transport system permease protein